MNADVVRTMSIAGRWLDVLTRKFSIQSSKTLNLGRRDSERSISIGYSGTANPSRMFDLYLWPNFVADVEPWQYGVL